MAKGSCGGGVNGVRLGLTLTAPFPNPFILEAETLPRPVDLADHMGRRLGRSFGVRPNSCAPVGHVVFSSGPGFLQGNRPTIVTISFNFLFY
jgi:hypothetical protein